MMTTETRSQLIEQMHIMQINHDRMCRDFDRQNELLAKEQQEHLLTKGSLMVRTKQLEDARSKATTVAVSGIAIYGVAVGFIIGYLFKMLAG